MGKSFWIEKSPPEFLMRFSLLFLTYINGISIKPEIVKPEVVEPDVEIPASLDRLKNAIYAPLMALKRTREDRFLNRLMFNQFYIADNQICEAVIAVYRTKDPAERPTKELKSEACEDINELGYSSILENEIKEFDELKHKAKSSGDIVTARTINEKRRRLWDLLAVPRQKWSLYYVKYRSEDVQESAS